MGTSVKEKPASTPVNTVIAGAPAELVAALLVTYQQRVMGRRAKEHRSDECIWNGHRVTWSHDSSALHVVNVRIYTNAMENERIEKRLAYLRNDLGREQIFLQGKAPHEVTEDDIAEADERMLYATRYSEAKANEQRLLKVIAETEGKLADQAGVKTIQVDLRKFGNSFTLIGDLPNIAGIAETAEPEPQLEAPVPPVPEPALEADDPRVTELEALDDDALIARGMEAGLAEIPDEREDLIKAILAAPVLIEDEEEAPDVPVLSLEEALTCSIEDADFSGLRAIARVLGMPNVEEFGKGALKEQIADVRSRWPQEDSVPTSEVQEPEGADSVHTETGQKAE